MKNWHWTVSAEIHGTGKLHPKISKWSRLSQSKRLSRSVYYCAAHLGITTYRNYRTVCQNIGQYRATFKNVRFIGWVGWLQYQTVSNSTSFATIWSFVWLIHRHMLIHGHSHNQIIYLLQVTAFTSGIITNSQCWQFLHCTATDHRIHDVSFDQHCIKVGQVVKCHLKTRLTRDVGQCPTWWPPCRI